MKKFITVFILLCFITMSLFCKAQSIIVNKKIFPHTPILDNFNRADANDLGASWVQGFGGVLGVFGISSNQMDIYSQVSTYTMNYYNTSYGAEQEAFITIVQWGDAARATIGIKQSNIETTNASDGYTMSIYANNTVKLKRQDDSVSTDLTNESLRFTISNGDKFGISYINGVIYGWHKPVNSTWYIASQYADTTYENLEGYINVNAQNATTILFDDFGGGTLPSGISGEGGTCSTQTEIISIADDGNSRELATYTLGQSFAGNDKPLYSISVYKKEGNTGTIRVRIGTSADLSTTYTEEITINVSAAEAFYEGLSDTQPTLTSGTWYIMCVNGTSTHSIGINESNPYAGGIYYYGTGGTFNGNNNEAGRDLAIKVKTCD